MALPIGPFPFTLTDGTLADANQVMANFNTLLNGVNALAPLSVPIAGSTSNVRGSLATAGTTITFSADSITLGTALNGTLYTLVNYSQSLNTATTGAGGMDTGTTPTSSYVAVYAIYNPTAPAISILGTLGGSAAPTIYAGGALPAGYTASALLGVWPTNATPALVPGYIRNRTYQYQSFVTVLNASTTNHASPTSLSISTAVPPNAVSYYGLLFFAGNGSNVQTNLQGAICSDATGVSATWNGLQIASTSNANGSPFPPILITTAQTLFYQTSGVGATISFSIGISGYSW
jgi:hypothetical protein